MKTFTLNYKFTKEEVRAWLNRRHVSREPVPDRDRLLEQLVGKTADREDLSAGTFSPSDIKLNNIFTAMDTGGASVLGEATTRRLATHGTKVALFDTLSENLLRLYQLSHGTTAPEFLEKAVSFFVQEFDIRRVWWGLSPQEMCSKGPSIHQTGYLKLPDRDLDNWLQLIPESAFSNEIERNAGKGLHASCSHVQNASPQRVYELIEETDLRHVMGICLDWQCTGQRFFVTLFRGRDDERFSDHEALLFRNFLRHVLQIWHHKLQDTLSGFSFASCSELAIARKDGRIVYIGVGMHALLASMCSHWNGMSIPADLLKEGEKLPSCRRLADSMLNMFSRDDYIWLVNVNSNPGLGTNRHVRQEYHAASTAFA